MNRVIARAKSLAVGYGGKSLFEIPSLEIEAGSLLLVVGPNGAGKSALLRTLVGVEKPCGGALEYFFNESWAPLARVTGKSRVETVSWCPQSESPEFGFTVEKYVAMACLARKDSMFESQEDWAVVHQVLEQTRSSHLAKRAVSELSGGEQRRVMIARSLAQDAKLIALDEPFTFVDARSQDAIFALLVEIAQSGKAVVATVHDLTLVSELSQACPCRLLAIGKNGVVTAPDSTLWEVGEYLNGNALEETFDHVFERVRLAGGVVGIFSRTVSQKNGS